jgi:hypothetical protein
LSRAFALRFLLLASLLGAGSLPFQVPLAQALLPLFRSELAWLDDAFRIDELRIAKDGAESVIRLEVGLARDIVMNGHAASPDPRGKAHSTTLVANLSLPAVLLIAVAMAWPARHSAAYAWRALALVPALLLMWMFDVPFVLWSGFWGLIVDALDPGRFSPLLIWEHFLHSGGRLALAATLGGSIGAWTSELSAGRN